MGKLQWEDDGSLIIRFVDEYLRQDGIFVLRLLEHNVKPITLTHFVCTLWDYFKDNQQKGTRGV